MPIIALFLINIYEIIFCLAKIKGVVYYFTFRQKSGMICLRLN